MIGWVLAAHATTHGRRKEIGAKKSVHVMRRAARVKTIAARMDREISSVAPEMTDGALTVLVMRIARGVTTSADLMDHDPKRVPRVTAVAISTDLESRADARTAIMVGR